MYRDPNVAEIVGRIVGERIGSEHRAGEGGVILGPSSPTSLGYPLWGMARRQRDLGRWGSVRLSASSSFLAALVGFASLV